MRTGELGGEASCLPFQCCGSVALEGCISSNCWQVQPYRTLFWLSLAEPLGSAYAGVASAEWKHLMIRTRAPLASCCEHLVLHLIAIPLLSLVLAGQALGEQPFFMGLSVIPGAD